MRHAPANLMVSALRNARYIERISGYSARLIVRFAENDSMLFLTKASLRKKIERAGEAQAIAVRIEMGAEQRELRDEIFRLKGLLAESEAKNSRFAARIRVAEERHQALLLKIGLLGFQVEPVPEVPARPATFKVTKVVR